MDDDQHQQLMEDLANDFLCYRSSFESTTDPPRRRRRQRPERACESPSPAARCSPLDSPGPIGPPVIAHPAQKSHAVAARAPVSSVEAIGVGGKRMMDPTSRGASAKSFIGISPQTPNAPAGPNPTSSTKHDLLRASNHAITPSARKFLWMLKSRADSAHAPRHRHASAESTSRALSGGTVPAAATETSHHAVPRSQSEPLREPAKTLLHWAQRPVAPVEIQRATSLQKLHAALARAPSLPNIAAGRPNPKPKGFKAVAHAVIATFSLQRERAPTDLPRADSGVTDADVAMLAWEHTERLALGRRRAGSVGAHDAVAPCVAPPPPVQRQAARKLLCATSSDALLRGSTSRALSLIRETGLDLTSRAGV